MVYVVDTHTLLWYLTGDASLGRRAAAVLDEPTASLIIPTIVLAEARYLSRKGRTNITFEEVLTTIERDERCLIYPLDLAIVKQLPLHLDLHDAFIVGTALVYRNVLHEEVTILTKDEAIVQAELVQIVWD